MKQSRPDKMPDPTATSQNEPYMEARNTKSQSADRAEPVSPSAAKGSTSDAVFWEVVQGLQEQRYAPGQRLIESSLAARLNVGRNSVREAMQRLAAEGVVDLSRHKGASIRTLSRQEALDLLEIAERLLGLLARTAARGAGDPANVARLNQVMQQLDEADELRDPVAFSKARRHFYHVLLSMGGNHDLRRLVTTIHIPILYARQRVPALQRIRLADYKKIAAAVLAGDAETADVEGMRHVRNVRNALQDDESRAETDFASELAG